MANIVSSSDQPAPKEEGSSPTAKTRFPPNMEQLLHLQDPELMMHWCTTTYRSMARDQATETLWQMTIPLLSLQFPALRHGILALSAVQLAQDTSNPAQKERYLLSAREHQSRALAGFRLDSVENLTSTQCNAAFAMCCILVVYPFAYCLIDEPNVEDEERPRVLDRLLEVFEVTHRLKGAMTRMIDRVASGELCPLVRADLTRPAMIDMSQLIISALRTRNAVEAKQNPSHERGVYEQTLQHLRYSLEQVMGGGEPKDSAFCWAFSIPVRFLALLREREPLALVVWAHYVVVLHYMHHSVWMGIWGRRILKEIADCLYPEWQRMIIWPIEATGCLVPEV